MAAKKKLFFFALAACAQAGPRAPPGYGLTRAGAVEVCLPPGERAFLKALRCPDGTAAETKLLGSAGARSPVADPERALLQMDPGRPLAPGEPDLHPLTAFEARCGPQTTTLFLDMYHCPAKRPSAPEGFALSE